MTKDELANGWVALQYAHQADNASREHISVGKELGRLAHEEPAVCLDLIVEVIRLDSGELVLSNVAAGPLENVIAENGSVVVDEIERLAREDAAFKKALSLVWPRDTSDIWRRVERSAA